MTERKGFMGDRRGFSPQNGFPEISVYNNLCNPFKTRNTIIYYFLQDFSSRWRVNREYDCVTLKNFDDERARMMLVTLSFQVCHQHPSLTIMNHDVNIV